MIHGLSKKIRAKKLLLVPTRKDEKLSCKQKDEKRHWKNVVFVLFEKTHGLSLLVELSITIFKKNVNLKKNCTLGEHKYRVKVF